MCGCATCKATVDSSHHTHTNRHMERINYVWRLLRAVERKLSSSWWDCEWNGRKHACDCDRKTQEPFPFKSPQRLRMRAGWKNVFPSSASQLLYQPIALATFPGNSNQKRTQPNSIPHSLRPIEATVNPWKREYATIAPSSDNAIEERASVCVCVLIPSLHSVCFPHCPWGAENACMRVLTVAVLLSVGGRTSFPLRQWRKHSSHCRERKGT